MLTWAYETVCVHPFLKSPQVSYTHFEQEARSFCEFPDVILCMFLDHTKLRDALALNCTCRCINDAIRSSCRERMDVQFERIVSHFPAHVQSSVPMAVWLDLEWIEFRRKWMGSTGYIDRVNPKEVPGHPFKCCRDSYGRLTVLMRRKNDVAVLFQRYTDDTRVWVFASKSLPIVGCRLSDSMAARLALWLAYDYADFPMEDP